MMNKKTGKIILFLPLAILVVFNVVFILSYLKGKEDYLHTACRIVLNDFYGLHSVAFGIVLAILCGLGLRKKISGAVFLRRAFLAFLLFMIAVNLSFFPELNRDTKGQESTRFRRLRTPHLEEAVRSSAAKSAGAIEKYLQLGNDLNGKILIVPRPSEDEESSLIIGFVGPRAVVRKNYPYLIRADDLEFLKTLNARTSRFSIKDKMTESIVIVSEDPDAEEFTLFRHDRTIFFFSPEIVKRLPMNLHD
jgi:hypothetical protein